MRSLILITNPLAGDGRSAALAAGVATLAPGFRVERPASPQELATALERPGTAAVVVGGDGTLHHALPALLRSGVPTAVLPGGTVNDFALAMGLTADWTRLPALLADGAPADAPLLEVNGRPFAVYGSLGIAQEGGMAMARSRRALRWLRRWLPRLHLPLATALTALTSRTYLRTLRIDCDGASVVRRTPGLFVVNQARISRNIDLVWDGPDGSGRFRVIVLRDLGRLRLLRTLARLFLRKQLGAVADDVEVFDTTRLSVEAEDGKPLRFSADGEPSAEAARLEIRRAPLPLRVYRVPAA